MQVASAALDMLARYGTPDDDVIHPALSGPRVAASVACILIVSQYGEDLPASFSTTLVANPFPFDREMFQVVLHHTPDSRRVDKEALKAVVKKIEEGESRQEVVPRLGRKLDVGTTFVLEDDFLVVFSWPANDSLVYACVRFLIFLLLSSSPGVSLIFFAPLRSGSPDELLWSVSGCLRIGHRTDSA